MSENGYCETCGAGYGEYMACEEVNCQWKQEQEMNDAAGKQVTIADIVGKVRKVDALIAEKEAAFEEEIKPLKDMSEAGRAFLLKHLNDTGLKSASTPQGGFNKRTKTTYRIEDREKFKKFVIDGGLWEIIVWRANDAMCDDYVQARKEAPPGTYRNAVDILTVTAPPKPRLRKKRPNSLTAEEWAKIEAAVDAELEAEEERAALESNGEDE